MEREGEHFFCKGCGFWSSDLSFAKHHNKPECNLRGLTDEEAHNLYLLHGWEDPLNHEFPDPSIAEEVRAVLRCPTTGAATKAIEHWGCWKSEKDLFDDVHRFRVLGGVEVERPKLVRSHRVGEVLKTFLRFDAKDSEKYNYDRDQLRDRWTGIFKKAGFTDPECQVLWQELELDVIVNEDFEPWD